MSNVSLKFMLPEIRPLLTLNMLSPILQLLNNEGSLM